MLNEFGHEKELFDRVCENALNGASIDDLSAEELEAHRKWVAENWADLTGNFDNE